MVTVAEFARILATQNPGKPGQSQAFDGTGAKKHSLSAHVDPIIGRFKKPGFLEKPAS